MGWMRDGAGAGGKAHPHARPGHSATRPRRPLAHGAVAVALAGESATTELCCRRAERACRAACGPPGGQPAGAAKEGHALPAAPGGKDVSQRAQEQRRRSRHQETPARGKDLWPPGASAARGRLRTPTKRRKLTKPGVHAARCHLHPLLADNAVRLRPVPIEIGARILDDRRPASRYSVTGPGINTREPLPAAVRDHAADIVANAGATPATMPCRGASYLPSCSASASDGHPRLDCHDRIGSGPERCFAPAVTAHWVPTMRPPRCPAIWPPGQGAHGSG